MSRTKTIAELKREKLMLEIKILKLQHRELKDRTWKSFDERYINRR